MPEEYLNFQPEKFKVLVRYLIQVAKEKRCVTYGEIENVFGLSHEQAGYYSGILGDYCFNEGLPPLNGLIINATSCVPSEGFDWYNEQYGREWGQIISECWKTFHVTSTREKQVQDFSKRDISVDEFLSDYEGPSSYY